MRRSDRARLLSTFGVRGRVVRVLRPGGAREPAGGSRRGADATRGVTGPGFGQLDVSADRLPRMPPGPPGGGCDARTPPVGGSARPRRGARREPRPKRANRSQPKNRAAIPAVRAVSDAEAHHLRGGDYGPRLGGGHGRRRDEGRGRRGEAGDKRGLHDATHRSQRRVDYVRSTSRAQLTRHGEAWLPLRRCASPAVTSPPSPSVSPRLRQRSRAVRPRPQQSIAPQE